MHGAWKLGIDVGGTFTDAVAVNASSGQLRTTKVPSSTSDLVDNVESVLKALDLDWEDAAEIVLGTTVVTNALVEGRFAPVALVATTGYADTVEIGRQNRRDLYRLDALQKLPPLVPREHRVEVAERVGPSGRVIKALEQADLQETVNRVVRLGLQSAAVALQHSYANHSHESQIGRELRRALPHVALSHEINPEPREYERTNATVLNAALMPLVAERLGALAKRAGNRTRLHLFHSAGGMASATTVQERPLSLALSGPAAGAAAAAAVARELGLDAAISFDMGGTTTDTCMILDGQVAITSGQALAGRPVRQLMVAVESIGAGGGSIARLDGNAIRVGPDSAGADPGPACYGKGGRQPTVTDANVVLGYLNADRRLGGTVRLDPRSARDSMSPAASFFGVSPEAVALGIHRIANASMARALRRVTVERGVDARRCTLLAFGGAGPMHAVALAREFGIARVVVPRFSSAFSALGCLTAALSYTEQHALHMSSAHWDAATMASLYDRVWRRLAEPIFAAGYRREQLKTEQVALIHFVGQSDAVEVPFELPADPLRLGEDFRTRHQALYGFVTDEPWELEAIRIKVSALRNPGPFCAASAGSTAEPRLAGIATCWFDGEASVTCRRYLRDGLAAEVRIGGPAIVEDEWSTTVVDPQSSLWADANGHLHLEVGGLP